MRTILLLSSLISLQLTRASCPEDGDFQSIEASTDLIWCPCNDGFFCARLDVPLDYQDPKLGRASVPLVKLAAQSNSTDGPYQGMLLVNPGGPGSSGVELVLGSGNLIHTIAGTNWDIVGFDPRGIYLSEPAANCSAPAAASNSSSSSSSSSDLEARSVPRVTDDYAQSLVDYGAALGAACGASIGGSTGAGPHMSTAVTARDMASIADAFAATADAQRGTALPARLVNYYGISYGTFLGQTFASLFPDRVGRVALDGVVGPEGYLSSFNADGIVHLDEVIAAFFVYCHHAGPSRCPFDAGGSAEAVYQRFNSSLARLDAARAEEEGWANATEVATALLSVKYALLTTAYAPSVYFGVLAGVLLGLEGAIATGNLTAWVGSVNDTYGDPTVAGQARLPNQWGAGVLCSDQGDKWYGRTLGDFRPVLDELERESIVGELWSKAELLCLGWPIRASEVFAGPFGGDTANPILFVSNTLDPVTPIDSGSAYSSAPKYKDAQILVVEGMGHTTNGSQSSCGFANIGAWFRNGQLASRDAYCPLETGPFGVLLNGSLEQIVQQSGLADLVG